MKFYHTLISRGYWSVAGDGTGQAGTGEGASGSADDNAAGEGAQGAATEGKNEPKTGDEPPAKPSDAEAKLLKEVMQKKEKLRALEEQFNAAQEQLKAFEGIDAAEVRKLMEQRAAEEQRKLEEKGQWDALKKQMTESHEKALKALKDELDSVKGALSQKDSVIEQLTVGHTFDASSFISEEMTMTPRKARVVYGAHFDVVDGAVVGFDKPRGAANRVPLVDGKGDHLSFDEAIRKIVDQDPDRDALLRAKAKPGADSKTISSKIPAEKPELRGHSRIAAALGSAK